MGRSRNPGSLGSRTNTLDRGSQYRRFVEHRRRNGFRVRRSHQRTANATPTGAASIREADSIALSAHPSTR
jgi:hypothetical protein